VETFKDRLLKVIELLGKNNSTFAIEAGLSPAVIQMYVGKRGSEPNQKTLDKIFRAFPQINPSYLSTGHGEPLRSVAVSQSGNSGNTVGNVSGGNVALHYATVSDCERDLAAALAELTSLRAQLRDKETIIELLKIQQSPKQ
jgi:hypothetical protein